MKKENKRLNISLEQYNFRNSKTFIMYFVLGFTLLIWVLLTAWLYKTFNEYTLTEKVLMYFAGFVVVAFSAALGEQDRIPIPFVIIEFFEEKREEVTSVNLDSEDNWIVKTNKGTYILQLTNNDITSCESLNTKS